MQTYRHCFMQIKHITCANAYVGFFTAVARGAWRVASQPSGEEFESQKY